jgi:hypothetical protein
MNSLTFHINGNPEETLHFTVSKIVNAGYTGKDQASVQAHIDELKEKGIPAPEETPVYFPVFEEGLVQRESFDVLHDDDNTGEAEYALLFTDREIFVAAANDHTDRKMEETDIPKAKQVYPNFISRDVWRLDDVLAHWDAIEIRGWIRREAGGERVLFQKGTLSALMGPEELIERVKAIVDLPSLEGLVVLSGTIASDFSIEYSPYFEVELHDPVRKRTLAVATEFHPVTDWFKKNV